MDKLVYPWTTDNGELASKDDVATTATSRGLIAAGVDVGGVARFLRVDNQGRVELAPGTLPTDHFEANFLVGNVPAGDPATAQAAPFQYFGDPGDGTGIEAALAAAAAAGGGRVYIRSGTYDFGLGAVAAPLTVPANTTVQGAGQATRIITKTSGDQGAFVLAPGIGDPSLSSLRSLGIAVPPPSAPGAGTGSIGAVLLQSGGCILDSVNIEVSTDPGSAMRSGVVVETTGSTPIPQSSIESCVVTTSTSTLGSSTATSGIRIIEGQVAARNITLLNLDIAIELTNTTTTPNSGGCLFLGEQVFVAGGLQYGVSLVEAPGATNTASARIGSGIFVADSSSPEPLGAGTRAGVHVEAGTLSVISSCLILFWETGVDVRPTAAASVKIDECSIAFCNRGVYFGAGTENSDLSDTEIGSAFGGLPITANVGIELDGASDVAIHGCTIRVSDYLGSGAATFFLISTNTFDLVVSGSDFRNFDGPLALSSGMLFNGGDDVTVSNNTIYANIQNDAIASTNTGGANPWNRLTITGNAIEMAEGKSAIYIESVVGGVPTEGRATVTGNAINQSSATAGISTVQILANRVTFTGNTIAPNSLAPAVRVFGSENIVSSNNLSLDVPPAFAAIALEATANDNVVIGNVCRTVPAVDNTLGGVGNEVAHNI